MNPLFDQYGRKNQNGFMNGFAQFASNFRRNSNKSPEDAVKELIENGQMTQEQFEQYKNIANQITGKHY